MQPQPFSLVGDGPVHLQDLHHGAALDMAWDQRSAGCPGLVPSQGPGQQRTPGCPKETWCVKNAGNLPRLDERHRRTGHLAQHRVRQVDSTGRRSPRGRHGGPAELRSYATPATRGPMTHKATKACRLHQATEHRLVHSGPFQLNALELSNVAATLASGGMWCPPNPIDKIFDRTATRFVHHRAVRPSGARRTGQHVANALSKDDQIGGTAAGSAVSVGWNLPMSQDRHHRVASVSGFVGFTNHYAAANYIFADSSSPSGICSFPLRRAAAVTCTAATSPHVPGSRR